jgi:hypothetical protein
MKIELPTEIELTQAILDTLSIDDIIYAEIANYTKPDENSLTDIIFAKMTGHIKQIIIHAIKEEQLICYKTNENTYIQAGELLLNHQNYFNYFNMGISNFVFFVNKNVSLKVTKKHLVYKRNNKKYHLLYSPIPRYLLMRGLPSEWFEQNFCAKE